MVAASLIIPTYNRAENLRTCLDALARQTQPVDDYEVVVVVDGSTDATASMLQSYSAPFQLQVVQQENRGQTAAINQGANAAQGRVLIFLDDDILASPRLVEEHLKAHAGGEKIVGIGKITITLPDTADWYVRIFTREWDRAYARLDGREKQPSWEDCFGGNLSVRRETYLAIGGNSKDLKRAYDLDLGYRLWRSGCSLVYLPNALASQYQMKKLHDLASDSAKSGQACVALARKHPSLLAPLLGAFGEQRPFLATLLRLLLLFQPSLSTVERLIRLAGKTAEKETTYHLVQRYAFWRAVRDEMPDRQSWGSLIQGIPILMYHAFAPSKEPASRYILPIQHFEKQMAWLKLNGYHVLRLSDYLEYRISNRLPPEKSVILTIDDGYADIRELAYPVLRKYSFSATIFLVNQGIGDANQWDQGGDLFRRPMLTWENIREMHQAGIDFGAHTCTHPDLTTIPAESARGEIQKSKTDLEQKLSGPVVTFAYPYGKFTREIEDLAQQAGFQGSVSVNIGKNTLVTPLHALRRVEIRGTDNLLGFALAVRYGLDPDNFRKQFLRNPFIKRNIGRIETPSVAK